MPAFLVDKVSRSVTDEDGRPLKVLREVECALARGRLTALTGPSGGGKTSLLRLLNRLDVPDSGRVTYLGQDLGGFNPRELRRRVGFVAQQPHIFAVTARENLMQGLAYQQGRKRLPDNGRLREICDLCRFPEELLERSALKLSVGQQQRLALARALVLEPEVLLLDEPTSALDRPTAESVGRALRQLCDQGMTVILVSHDLDWVKAWADEVLFLAEGRLLVRKAVADFFANPGHQLAEAFLAGELEQEVVDG